MSKAHTAWAPASVPSLVQALLDDPAAEVTKDSSAFWVLVAALKSFMVCFHRAVRCRLRGAFRPLPCMHTDCYLAWQAAICSISMPQTLTCTSVQCMRAWIDHARIPCVLSLPESLSEAGACV
jgi:hypothetical protein